LQFDENADYRRLKLANIADEFRREALAMDVDRSVGADRLVAILIIERLVAERGAPEHLRMERPRAHRLGPAGLVTAATRDELLNIEEFGNLVEAQVIVEAWRIEYNTYRPHSSLGGLTPAEFATRWASGHQITGTLDTTPALASALGAT
jgi:putative transposase